MHTTAPVHGTTLSADKCFLQVCMPWIASVEDPSPLVCPVIHAALLACPPSTQLVAFHTARHPVHAIRAVSMQHVLQSAALCMALPCCMVSSWVAALCCGRETTRQPSCGASRLGMPACRQPGCSGHSAQPHGLVVRDCRPSCPRPVPLPT